ncbi:MAG: hypothetical protein WCZ26_09245, partial [Methanothrix soehngenii]
QSGKSRGPIDAFDDRSELDLEAHPLRLLAKGVWRTAARWKKQRSGTDRSEALRWDGDRRAAALDIDPPGRCWTSVRGRELRSCL